MKNPPSNRAVQPGKLASALTLLASAFTLFAAALVLVGPGPALLFGAICIAAFAAWLMAYVPENDAHSHSLSLYLLVPPVLLALNALRYASG